MEFFSKLEETNAKIHSLDRRLSLFDKFDKKLQNMEDKLRNTFELKCEQIQSDVYKLSSDLSIIRCRNN